ncbi:chorismate lyase [Alcaligenaceae bacterium 429]|uniref:chorismate--pyruvate lyase family protein n=1 Tax=Paenalcaligenes sp. Me52 TaxID=3392038 RepID=UPI001092CBBE|nr:chorismate lyase [Alcaligenaceae bacterium 429]
MKFCPPAENSWTSQLPSDLAPLPAFWLDKPGALTASLRNLGQLTLAVQAERATTLHEEESWMLDQPQAWVREIVMSLDEQPMVCARSFCTVAASDDQWGSIKNLGTKPLADILYNDPEVSRSNFCYRLNTETDSALAPLAQHTFHTQALQPLYARCSRFMRQNQALIVIECFHPEFWTRYPNSQLLA